MEKLPYIHLQGKDYADQVHIIMGMLLVQMLNLELAARGCLLRNEGKNKYDEAILSLEKVKEGEVLKVNHLTEPNFLPQVIDKFNEAFEGKCKPLDKVRINRIRKAMAHGRVLSIKKPFPMQIYNFEKDKGGKVKVVYAEKMTANWLKETVSYIAGEANRIFDFMKTLHATVP